MRAAVIALVLAVAGCLTDAPSMPAELDEPVFPSWSAPTDEIRPGDSMGSALVGLSTLVPGGSPCTVNFLFQNDSSLFIGTAAHCLGEDATIGEVKRVGYHGAGGRFVNVSLAYSSWLQDGFDRETFDASCNANPTVSMSEDPLCWNDLALLEIPPAEWTSFHPLPRDADHLGAHSVPEPGDPVWTRGESWFRGATPEQIDARDGVVLDVTSLRVLAHFGIPSTDGDSGAPVITADGAAVGVLTYLHNAPPTVNGITRLDVLLEQASDAGFPVTLVTFTA